MNVPAICAPWQQQMEASAETRQILANVILDTCLANLETPFFSALAAIGNPATPNAARQLSKNVVDADFDGFICKGHEISGEIFEQLVRVCNGKGFANALPSEEREDLLDRFSVTDAEIENISYERLTDLINAYTDPTAEYLGPISIRGKDDLAWVSDRAALPVPLPAWGDLVRQFGLPHYLNDSAGVVVIYPRGGIPQTLHLPRSFDGIDWPPFQIEGNCAASNGTTRPLDGQPARPEAVHRGCNVARNQLILTAWQ